MRQITALMLLGAAIGIVAPFGAGGFVELAQAQNQASTPEGFRIIGNIYWVGGEYGSYLITTPQGHILHDTKQDERRGNPSNCWNSSRAQCLAAAIAPSTSCCWT